jgi:hypothetical protein
MRGFVIFFLSLLGTALHAQDVVWSAPTKVADRTSAESLGKNNEGSFVVKKPVGVSHNITLERYDDNMKLWKSRAFYTKKDEYYAEAVLTSHGIQLFGVTHDREKKEIQVRLQYVDFKLESFGTDSLLFTFPDGEFNEKYLQVYKAKSSSSVLFLYTTQSVEIPSQFNFVLIDTAGVKLQSGLFNINIETKYDIDDVAYLDDRVVMLVREDVKKKQTKQGFQYTLCYGRYGDANFAQTSLFNDSFVVTDGKLKADYRNNDIVFGGLYELRDSGYAKGYSLWRYGSSTTLWERHVFPNSVIADMAGKTARLRGLYNLRVGDILLRKDGGFIITCEEYQETREAIADMAMYGISQTNFRYYYYFQNMLLLSVNPDGDIQWHSILRKDQVSVNDDGVYSSYALAAMADKIVYVYNDLSRKDWNLSLYEVNADGTVNNRIIIKAQDYDARLMPQYGEQLSYNEIIIPAMDRRGQLLLKVKL